MLLPSFLLYLPYKGLTPYCFSQFINDVFLDCCTFPARNYHHNKKSCNRTIYKCDLQDFSYILCDSWYTKQNLISVIDEYPNLGLIGNARSDSVLYDLAPERTGRRGRPAKHGRQFSFQEQIFYVSFVKNIETGIKFTWLVNAIKRLVGRQGYHL